jgi:glyoxylase-like metal-dependent hydrolase (beta-lactamase superfamily II)
MTTPELKTIANRVWVRQAVDNISWFDLGDGAAIVDTGEAQPGLAEDVEQMLEQTLEKTPLTWLLNTHTHYDHTGLNDHLKQKHDVEIINGRDNRVTDGGGLTLGGSLRTARMFSAGGVHTPEDSCIHLPDDDILFVGDLFGWGLVPVNGELTAAKADRIVNIYDDLIALQARIVVPGHGPHCSTAQLERWLEYFRWLSKGVVTGIEQGLTDEEIARQLPPPEDMTDWWRFLDWKHENSVGKVLDLARNGWDGLAG